MTCWLRDNGVYWIKTRVCAHRIDVRDECEGRTDPCHLISQRLLLRELGSRKAGHEMLVVPGCRKHHHLFDVARKLKVPRERLPESVETFAAAHNLGWYLTREYGALQKEEDPTEAEAA